MTEHFCTSILQIKILICIIFLSVGKNTVSVFICFSTVGKDLISHNVVSCPRTNKYFKHLMHFSTLLYEKDRRTCAVVSKTSHVLSKSEQPLGCFSTWKFRFTSYPSTEWKMKSFPALQGNRAPVLLVGMQFFQQLDAVHSVALWNFTGHSHQENMRKLNNTSFNDPKSPLVKLVQTDLVLTNNGLYL